MKFKPLFFQTLFAAALLFAGCPADKCPDGVNAVLINLEGLDGCTWVFELEDGQRLEPINLHQYEFDLKNGIKVKLNYTEAIDMMSICMVGKMVNITCISKR